mgnify:CR=1 FL=1
MFEQSKEKYPLTSESLSLKNKSKTGKVNESVFLSRIRSVNILHFISATAQLFLGVCVVALSLAELIHPTWLATVMTVLGSLTSVIGLYFMYNIFSSIGTFDSLLNKAIKRVITFQN